MFEEVQMRKPAHYGVADASEIVYQGDTISDWSSYQLLSFFVMPFAPISWVVKHRRFRWLKLPTRCSSKATIPAKVWWHPLQYDVAMICFLLCENAHFDQTGQNLTVFLNKP